jgi:hypothetical protein
MGESRNWWGACRDWYLGLSPAARWGVGVGFGLFLLVLIGSQGSDPSVPYPAAPYPDGPAGAPPYGLYPGDGGAYGPPAPYHPGEFAGRMSHGTIDTSGQGNHVISLDGEVLSLP